MNWVDNFIIKLYITNENIITMTSSTYLTSIEFAGSVDGDASSFEASPSSNRLMCGFSYTPDVQFFGQISKGLKCELYDGEKKLGTFYVVDFTPPAEGDVIATITAYDLLYNLINSDITPDFEILTGISSNDFIKQIFKSVGIPEERIRISEKITPIVLNYGVCLGKKLVEILKEFTLATDTYITLDANENIDIISKKIDVDKTAPILTDDNLYGLDTGSTFADAYTGIKLTYNRMTVSEIEEIANIETTLQPNVEVDLGTLTLENPLYSIETIKTNILSTINSLKATQNTLNIKLTSQYLEEITAKISVLGKSIQFIESFLEKKQEVANENVVSVSTQIIQDTAPATTLINALFERINNRVLTSYSMPDVFDIVLCKVFRVLSISKGLTEAYYYVHSFTFSIVEGEVDLQLVLKEINQGGAVSG